jgi:hypothetical protein
MARKPITDMSAWPSLSIEGNLIAPAMIAKIDQRAAPEQTPQDYSVRKGLTIREEISTAFRVGQSHFDAFAKIETPTQDATKRFVSSFFKETFGFDDSGPADGIIALSAGEGRVPIVVVPPSEEKLDRKSPTLSTERTRSPALALQDYLNERDEALWGIVTNGTLLRLMRDNASLTRPAYIEADLAQIFTNEDIASFAVLWLLIHRSRFGVNSAPATDCALERWRDTGSKEGEVARDRLAAQVQIALKVLGSGFLEVNPDLATKLKSGDVNLTEWFNELLRLVYRLIFLMVAEDRNLLHPAGAKTDARTLYSQGYSLAALRKQCYRAATWDKHHDRFEAVKIVFHALAHGQSALALPALGGLFAEDRLPNLKTAHLRNKAFMEALYRLSWLSDKSGMVPVNWRAMETEELGSVYETLLELQPQLGDDGKTLVFASEAAEQKGNQRKTTGSYYTPDSLVQALLDTTLDPVLDKTDPDKLLNLSIIDPACGSGHFLLAAARRIATRLARHRAEGTPALSDFRHALRDVARSCLHGVDRNPMAVELTKVALWIETVDPGLPLGFFDAQIRCGDALLGVFDLQVLEDGIPDAAYKPLTGDDKDTARFYLKTNRDEKSGQGSFDFSGGRSSLPTAPLSAEFSDLRDLPEDSVAEVEAKARAYRSLRKQQAFQRTRMGCNLYVSAFLLPKVGPVPRGDGERCVPTSEDVWLAIGQGKGRRPIMENASTATHARALHWPLEFPDVMQRGGFDVVLGNPPWERIKLQEKEFFATRDPDIATASNAAARTRKIKALAAAETGTPARQLYDRFVAAKRQSEAISTFVRIDADDGGRFAFTGTGDVNTYALFAELFTNLSRARAGIIVPTGIATDATTAPFFAHLVETRRLARLVDFENSAPTFTAVHRSFKFCLLTLGRGEDQAHFAFFLTDTAQMAEPQRNFTLSPEQIAAINPNTRTAPVFRSRMDAALTAKIYGNTPVLIDEGKGEEGNPWGIKFSILFHMANDSGLFRTAAQLAEAGLVRDGSDWLTPPPLQGEMPTDGASAGELLLQGGGQKPQKRYVPLYEAKMFDIYDHRSASYENRGDDRGNRVLPETQLHQHMDPSYEVQPFYWVAKSDVISALNDFPLGAMLVFNKVTGIGNERSFIPALMPVAGFGDSLNLMRSDKSAELNACLYANCASLCFDFVVRRKVGGVNINFFHVRQFPILPPTFYTEPRLAFLTPKVLELTYTSHSLAPFARDLGYDGPPFAWDEDRRATLRADLDAFYARAYGLSRDDLRYILDPAEVMGEDYPSETFRVLKNKELTKYGEYRTQRLVLAAWDRMVADGTFNRLGLSAQEIPATSVPHIELPPLAELPDGTWAWPATVQPADRIRFAAQYALWLCEQDRDGQNLPWAIACLAEPALLTRWLNGTEQAEWIRLMGAEAQSAQNVSRLRPQISGAWRQAFETLLSTGQLAENSSGEWVKGRHFESSGLRPESPHAQRAMFVLDAIRRLDMARIRESAPKEDNVIWTRFGHG